MAEIDIEPLHSWVEKQQALGQSIALFPTKALGGLLEREHAPAAGDALAMPWHWLNFLEKPQRSASGADGHPKTGGVLPPVPLPRRLWAAAS